jgi:hypothetical protein
MKTSMFTSILRSSLVAGALTIGSLASTPFASAQTTVAQAYIPFAFQNGNKVMPAGNYRLERVGSGIILLQGPSNTLSNIMMHPAIANRTPDHGKLVFDHAGGKYFLRQLWTAGTNEGLETPKSRAEKESQQTYQARNNNQEPNTIELALN